MAVLKQLLTPLAYLRIEHPLKRRFDLYVPFFIAAGITLFLFLLPNEISAFGRDGLVDGISGLIQILVGFFIASLAAVSTFQRSNLDEPLEGSPALLAVPIKGKKQKVTLTRRRFLSYLFGYLSFVALFLYFLGLFGTLSVDGVRALVPAVAHTAVKWIFISFYMFGVANLMVTTLLGLHYMTDRIHR